MEGMVVILSVPNIVELTEFPTGREGEGQRADKGTQKCKKLTYFRF